MIAPDGGQPRIVTIDITYLVRQALEAETRAAASDATAEPELSPAPTTTR